MVFASSISDFKSNIVSNFSKFLPIAFFIRTFSPPMDSIFLSNKFPNIVCKLLGFLFTDYNSLTGNSRFCGVKDNIRNFRI